MTTDNRTNEPTAEQVLVDEWIRQADSAKSMTGMDAIWFPDAEETLAVLRAHGLLPGGAPTEEQVEAAACDGHECLFPEEQEPSGRLILAPCLTCGTPAVDAIAKLKTDVQMWADTAEGLVRDMRAISDDFNANGNSRELGDPSAEVWHEAARMILKKLTEA